LRGNKQHTGGIRVGVKAIFIVWSAHSRRAETLATELGAQVFFVYEGGLTSKWLKLLRYVVQIWKTWGLLEKERPELVIVQSPPIFAPLIVATWCRLGAKLGRRVPYIIDCHPGTFFDPAWHWALPLLRILSQRAVVTLSSNEAAQKILRTWKVRSFFLADGLPALCPPVGTAGSEGEARVAVISTFASGEPIAELFEAARILPYVTFYVTGDPKLATTRLIAQKPGNVVLTGFLKGGAYTALLKNVHGLVILTDQPEDLSCGAYEAVAVAKPAVVSDWAENRRYFTQGFLYVRNTPEAIAEGVREMLNEKDTLAPKVIALRTELIERRKPQFEELAVLIREKA
jgi:hypothetical protein